MSKKADVITLFVLVAAGMSALGLGVALAQQGDAFGVFICVVAGGFAAFCAGVWAAWTVFEWKS